MKVTASQIAAMKVSREKWRDGKAVRSIHEMNWWWSTHGSQFCGMCYEYGKAYGTGCGDCPIKDNGHNCCKEYFCASRAYVHDNLLAFITAATDLYCRIDKLIQNCEVAE